MSYPVLSILDEVKDKLNNSRLVILEAPPGAGKSTVLPLHLLDEPWLKGRKIIMLEPRRLAARSVAMRMSDLRNESVGETVGYRVRFDSRVGKTTRLEVVTQGILTRFLQEDNSLEDVALLIFDEFHERSLQADLALTLSLQVQDILRPDLRILIMSATLNGELLSEKLKAPIVKSTGREYPVTLQYLPQNEQTSTANQVVTSIRKAVREGEGDILAFLPGSGEIKRAAELLDAENLPVTTYLLYGDLSFQKQQEAILPHPQGRRKVVLATSIAETSLTIEGVSIVIDSGYARVPRFDPRSGFTRLETVRVTRDAADQRAGRAGRLGPGTCYRLWSTAVQQNLVASRNPEILEADLVPLLLELCHWGIQDVNDLTWITPPPPGAISQAFDLLNQLGALDGRLITERGREMLALPTHPRIAHMLLEARHASTNPSQAVALATDIAAVLEERDPMPRTSGADLSLRIELLRRWRKGEKVAVEKSTLEKIERLARAWRQLFNISTDNDHVADTQIGRLLIGAYPERIAKQVAKHSERYKLINGRTARLPDHDPLQRDTWLAVAQVDAGGHEGKIFLAAPVDPEDLIDLATEQEIVSWDENRQMVVGSVDMRVGNLSLSSRALEKLPEEKKNEVLCGIIREKGLSFLDWGDTESAWQRRVLSLKKWRPDEAWPDVSDENLLNTVDEWLSPFLPDVYKRSDILKLDTTSILMSLLPWELQTRLNALAPVALQVPSGSMIKLQYFSDGRAPIMEVRLQEVFGLLETPSVNEGRNKVVLHLLSPGFKPVQVTQDLKSFWTSTYADVRKELRTRYPRHSWPEDPWTAQAVRGAKRRS